MDAGYRLLAARYIRKQAKLLRAQFDGILAAEDIEFVHRARVASRPLGARATMFDDCFKPKQVRRWKKAMRRIRAELGEARDKDVQIGFLRHTLDSLAEQACFAGISRLLVEWEYVREKLQRKVVKAVKCLQRKASLKKINRAAKRVMAKAESRDAPVQSSLSFVRAEEEILGRLDELLELQDCLGRPDDRLSHHAMRIAAKRLRYTMEIVRPIYSGRLDATLDVIKQVQALLGEVHDCDVWQEQLDQFAKTQGDRIIALYGHDKPFPRLNAGIEYLRQDRIRHRKLSFEHLVGLWAEFDAEGGWEKLVSIVQADGKFLDAPAISANGEKVAQSCDVVKETVVEEICTVDSGDGNGDQRASPALTPSNTP